AADLTRDPLVATAAALVGFGLLTPAEAAARYDAIGERVRSAAEQALSSRPLASATEVMAPLAPRRPERVAERATAGPARAAAADSWHRAAAAGGPARVFDTLLDEQSILGVALGGGLTGLLPVPEIQYLAYLHNAEDQIRGEA